MDERGQALGGMFRGGNIEAVFLQLMSMTPTTISACTFAASLRAIGYVIMLQAMPQGAAIIPPYLDQSDPS